MARRLYIVSAYRPELMGQLVINLGLSEDTKVFVDRRQGERRAEPHASAPNVNDRRLNDRRYWSIETALREHGVAVVELADSPLVR